MKLIGLHDAEKEKIKNKKFPNYALMKISSYHKNKGDTVEWWQPLNIYDKVYSSKVFDFTSENPYLPLNTIKGGTGYDNLLELPKEIDDIFPDYSIYPECDYAIGFITRGCIRNCEWCGVPKKEGYIRPYRKWQELIRSDSNKLILMDNNILGCDFGVEQLESLVNSDIKIDLNQGLDARLVTDDIAEILSRLKWIKYIRFSCDHVNQVDSIFKCCELLKKYGCSMYKIFIYTLIRKDLNEANYRVQALNKIKGISLYAQAERNGLKGIIPNKAQLEFAQRYVYGRAYKKESWQEYCRKRKLYF